MIEIEGKLAKQIYEEILRDERAMCMRNIGTEEEPVIRIGAAKQMTKLVIELPDNAITALHEIAAAYNVPFDKLVEQAIRHDIDMELSLCSDMTKYEATKILKKTGYVADGRWQQEFAKAGWLKGV